MENIGYYNGKTGPIETMMIPMNDRAVYFGDGVYDATYAANHVIFKIEDHISRFYSSCEKLRMKLDIGPEKLAAIVQSCVDRVDGANCFFVYWQATRGTGPRSHAFPESGSANLLITVSPSPMRPVGRKYKLITVEDTRFFHCDIKTINLIPSVMASQQAKEAGCDEAVFHRGPVVTECAHSNVSILKGGVFRTAPLSDLILPGTARKHLIALAGQNGIPVDETAFTLDDLMAADEVIVHSSGTLCNAASKIDGKPVGGKDPKTLGILQQAAIREFETYTGASFTACAR